MCYYKSMEQIKQTLDQTIYGYDPSEFMPIRVDGEIANWDAFAAYKVKRAMRHLGEFANKAVEATTHVAGEFTSIALR